MACHDILSTHRMFIKTAESALSRNVVRVCVSYHAVSACPLRYSDGASTVGTARTAPLGGRTGW
eukprot:4783439-Prymnesium_polylepis.2